MLVSFQKRFKNLQMFVDINIFRRIFLIFADDEGLIAKAYDKQKRIII